MKTRDAVRKERAGDEALRLAQWCEERAREHERTAYEKGRDEGGWGTYVYRRDDEIAADNLRAIAALLRYPPKRQKSPTHRKRCSMPMTSGGARKKDAVRMWLDDVRDPARFGCIGWVWVKTYDEAVALLATGRVIEASLDHDLSIAATLGQPCGERTGYDVVCWMEANNVFP